jgi:DNA-binding PadR family transcriptional regulator
MSKSSSLPTLGAEAKEGIMSMAHAILGLLMEGECHGYEIATTLGERIGGGAYNSGQVHQALGLLEVRGWALSREYEVSNRTRRLYRVTAAGRGEFLSWLDRPVAMGRPIRDEMVVKMSFLAEHDPERVVGILEGRKREYVRRLAQAQRATRRTKNEGASPLIRKLARDAFRFREEGELRWIEHCLSQLRGVVGSVALDVGSENVSHARP